VKKLGTNALIIICAIGGAIIGKWAVSGIFTKPVDYTEILMETANAINVNLPMVVDNDTHLVSTVGFNKTFTYKYKLVNYEVADMDVPKFQENMKPNLINAVCTSESMSEFRKMEIVVKYSYMDMNHKEIATFPIDTTECEKI